MRSGQVLQLLNKPQTALEIYQLGMRKVSKDDSQFQVSTSKTCLVTVLTKIWP